MTILGLVTIVAVVGAWIVRRRLVQFVLGATVAFPQTAGLIVGENGLPLFYLALAVVAALSVPALLVAVAGARGKPLPVSRRVVSDIAGVALVVWASVITIAGPRIFAGIGVFDPALGVDAQVGRLSPLAPGLDDLAQLAYLVVAVLFLLLAGRIVPVDHRLVAAALWVAVVLAAVRLVTEAVWPAELIENMPGYSYQTRQGRLAGTFYEPSVLGLYLVAAAAYFGARLTRGPGWRVRVPAFVALGLVAIDTAANQSGTALLGLAVLAVVATVVFIAGTLARPRRPVSALAVIGGVLVVAAVLTQLPAILEFTVGSAVEKTDSSSFSNRGAANARALELVVETFGLGVGLGGNRPSSLAMFLVSCLGILGFALFVVLAVAAIRAARGAPAAGARWALIGTLIAAIVAVPDLSTPLLWAALASSLGPASGPREAPPRAATLRPGSTVPVGRGAAGPPARALPSG